MWYQNGFKLAQLYNRTLQDSINTTANSYLDQLDKFAGQSDGITAERGQETDALATLDQR